MHQTPLAYPVDLAMLQKFAWVLFDALHYNADCPPRSGWCKWRGQSLICPFKPKLLLSTGGGSDACFVHGGRLLLEFGDGAYGGLWAFGGRFSGPGAYLSLTPGHTAWELAASRGLAVSWPSRVYHHICYRHLAKVRGAGGLSYTSRACGPVQTHHLM